VYTTANDRQDAVHIGVYQGENPLAIDNIFLGDFELVNIIPQPKGVPQIEVSFDIDANGILRVRAQDKASGQLQQIRIAPNSGLKEEQIKAMIVSAKEHASIQVRHSETEQYRLTCRKLIEECERELGGADVDRPAVLNWLKGMLARVQAEGLDGVKADLKELNQCVLRLRTAPRRA
jgi:molecular chaperone DnaK